MKEESEDDIGSSEDEWEWRAIRGLDINSHVDPNNILLTLIQKKMNIYEKCRKLNKKL